MHDNEHLFDLSSKNAVGFGQKLSFIIWYIGLKIAHLGPFSTWQPIENQQNFGYGTYSFHDKP
jgi:hypothetical protein